MDQIVTAEITATLDDVAHDFTLWRETRKHRGRIPNRLWDAAIGLTTSYPASKVAEALHLNYAELKKRLQPSEVSETDQRLSFVELDLSSRSEGSSSVSCHLEVETAHGSRFRCLVRGPVPDNLLRFVQTLL